MWVEELRLTNIKCFEDTTIRFARGLHRYPWITFLSENGGGKSTALQALALLLAGPESIPSLLPRPEGWVRDEQRLGSMRVKLSRGNSDPDKITNNGDRHIYSYKYDLTPGKGVPIGSRKYAEPALVEAEGSALKHLREVAFTPWPNGWFAAGYGAFRRFIQTANINVLSRDSPERYRNFFTLFGENDPLTSFDRWMLFLDYHISKYDDPKSKRQRDIGVDAINQLLSPGVKYAGISSNSRIQFEVNGKKVPTISLSDGYRSILELSGDLIWRLMNAFPESPSPLEEEGIVLIDELDIHLHPTWQRTIAGTLRAQFPNIQFIVATHSPFVAAGAGDDALTLKFTIRECAASVSEVQGVSSMSVDDVLESSAFGLVSTYSPQTQAKLSRFDALLQKHTRRTADEEKEYQALVAYVAEARPYGGPPVPGSLDDRIEKYLEKTLL